MQIEYPRTAGELAASIPRRELELALRQREEILAEVKLRLQEMGVRASAEELTDLLAQAAGRASVAIKEYIQEHDPICCDDPTGDLWFAVQVADGSGIADGQASLQNCNGGSQSGAYPYCGTFGATARVAYICQTYGTPDPPCDNSGEQSCWDSGGTWEPGNCTCTYPCIHSFSCAEWDDVNCVCLRV